MNSRYDLYEILPPEWVDAKSDREREVRAGFWSKVRKAARHIPFMEDVIAAYFCALDPQVPLRVRASLLAALAYFIAPVDAIPDFIVGLGYTDDISVLLGVMALVGTSITTAHREAARKILSDPDEIAREARAEADGRLFTGRKVNR